MAHVMKIKSAGLGPMLAHYARIPEERGYRRPNIDPTRTHGNYVLGATSAEDLAREVGARVREAEERHRQVTGRRVRRDADLLADWVVTLPEDCPPELEGKFFESVLGFCRARYGAGNVPGAFIHVDESRHHGHIPVVPVLDDGRLNATRKINRADLRSFHPDLNACVDKALGRHVSILLDEDDRAGKAISGVKDKKALTALRGQAEEDHRTAEDARREADEADRARTTAWNMAACARAEAARAREDAREARSEAGREGERADDARREAREAEKAEAEARAREAEANRAAAEATSRERTARESEAKADAATIRANERARTARIAAERAESEAAEARRGAERARVELADVRSQLAAARQELERVQVEISAVIERAKARFQTWWRKLDRSPSLDDRANEAARAIAIAMREAGIVDRDRDERVR